jgi:hypothetical protein
MSMCDCLPNQHQDMHRATWTGVDRRYRPTLHYGVLCLHCRRQKMMQGRLVYTDREAEQWLLPRRTG